LSVTITNAKTNEHLAKKVLKTGFHWTDHIKPLLFSTH